MVAPPVTRRESLRDEPQQLLRGAWQRGGSEEYQHVESQLQGEFR